MSLSARRRGRNAASGKKAQSSFAPDLEILHIKIKGKTDRFGLSCPFYAT